MKQLQHLRIFSPKIYFRGCLAAWHSPELFKPLPNHTSETITHLVQQAFPAQLRKKYKWCFRTKFTTVKAKKQWQKGRAIISYFKSHFGALLRGTSTTITTMLLRLLPQASCRTTLHSPTLAALPRVLQPRTWASSTRPHKTDPWMQSRASPTNGISPTTLLLSPLTYWPQATPSNYLTLKNTTDGVPPNAPLTHRTFQLVSK